MDLSRFEMPPTERNRMILEQTTVRTRCRACNSSITPMYDLGPMFVNDFPQTLADRGPKIPLTLAVCDNKDCELIQLNQTVPRDALYRTHYWYRSGVNETMRKELESIVEWGLGFLDRQPIAVMDIGANDGTLLAYAAKRCEGAWMLAYEPASNMQERLAATLYDTARTRYAIVEGFYPVGRSGSTIAADLIFSIAMFYDLEDPQSFVYSIAQDLSADGVWVVQLQDWMSMLLTNGVDCLCHEHLEYYTLKPILRMASLARLELTGIASSRSNGGSLRLAFKRAGGRAANKLTNDRAGELLEDHKTLASVPMVAQLDIFRQRCEAVRAELRTLLGRWYNMGGKVELLGASTKGNTLLQWLDLGPEIAGAAYERAVEKFGRLTITGVPILKEGGGEVTGKTLRLVLPWHFRDSLVKREVDYLRAQGRLLFPFPVPSVVSTSEITTFTPRDYPKVAQYPLNTILK